MYILRVSVVMDVMAMLGAMKGIEPTQWRIPIWLPAGLRLYAIEDELLEIANSGRFENEVMEDDALLCAILERLDDTDRDCRGCLWLREVGELVVLDVVGHGSRWRPRWLDRIPSPLRRLFPTLVRAYG